VLGTEAIAVNAAIVGERPTGLGLYALHLIEALDALGERLIVYTSQPDLVRAAHATVSAIPAAVRPERGTRGHLSRFFWIQTGLRHRLQLAKPAVLLNLFPEGLLAPGVPQVTVVHDLLPLHYPEEYPRQQYYFRYYVPAVLRFSRMVIVSSESTSRDIHRFYGVPPDKLRVVPCGYDAHQVSPERGGDETGLEPFALYVGSVMPHKNLTRLVEAFAEAARHGPIKLVIRGWGRPRHVHALRAHIESLGLQRRVDWEPYAKADELVRLYRNARMLLLPSLYESSGLPALEAMACGTPVITSNTSSLPEVVGHAALLVDPGDTGALAEAITRLFSDDRLAEELRGRGFDRARLFSWERTGRAAQSVIHDALSSP
jgi:glycosyltransferase involved in cell wall biosynthesis